MNRGVINGLLFGGAALIIGLALYLINKPLFLDPTIRFILSLALPITFMSKSALEKRRELNGFASFSEVLQPAYLTLIIGTVIFSIFQYIMMSADFELLEIQKTIAVESLESISGLANLSEENLADIREMKPEDLKPTPKGLLMGLSKNFILGFIIAVIIAFLIKRKNLASEQS